MPDSFSWDLDWEGPSPPLDLELEEEELEELYDECEEDGLEFDDEEAEETL